VCGTIGCVTDHRNDFFASRAATWDDRFPDDGPLFQQAVVELAPPTGAVAVDIGCGTGRALPYLRAAVGPSGVVVGLDLTVEMLVEARRRGRALVPGGLIRADAARLPLRDAACDALFAAGLLHHLADPVAGLCEFARVCRPGARLALFHPLGRAALAARHGSTLHPDDVRGEARLVPALAATGWSAELVDDGDDRYLAVAVRTLA
jgi:SAM-dependent methyltransferase